ncbi:MAG TPA: phosphatase PAP2 family protein [Candidatus Saccharimonadales bacterium]|nr:phosphatase PAP2 family protein [Candidatus Saccharimonadales bacterium]
MNKTKNGLIRIVGIAGALVCLGLFIHEPSFPTPDKLFVFLLFVFMALDQAREYLRRFAPFIAVILVYESFRSVADKLNTHVNYTLAPNIDKALFGGKLPTTYLQNWLWSGHVRWYDVLLYIPYLMFFIIPLFLAVLVWKSRDKYYWQVVTSYSLLFFGAYLTFLLMPTAPPWLASEHHVIDPIVRTSSNVWYAIGIHDFPSVYNHLSPNPVAAFPSLHAGVSVLFSLLVFKLYGRRWGLASTVYPLLLCFGVIYEGEHYFSDVLAGSLYAVAAYYLAPKVVVVLKRQRLVKAYSSNTRTALESKR